MPTNIERSTFLIFASNFIFFISGYLVYFILGRFLGPADFGIYSVVISLASLVAMMLVVGIEQSVSKFVSEQPEKADAIRNTALKMQFLLSTACFAIYFLIAPYLSEIFRDPSLTPYFQLSAFLFFVHPVYAIMSGVANGLKKFTLQAKMSVVYSVAKTGIMIGLVLMGFAIFGAIAGFILASIIGIILWVLFLGIRRTREHYHFGRIIDFGLPIMGFSIVITLLQDFGIYSIKALSDAAFSSSLAGYYTVALTIAKVPFGLMLSLSIIFFPLISSTTFNNDFKKTGFYISNSMRYCLMLIIPAILIFSATPRELISLLYGGAYVSASQTLVVLLFAFAFLSIFYLLATYLSASNRPRIAFSIGLATIALNILLNFILVPPYGELGAAFSLFFAILFGMVCAAIYVFWKFRALVRARSVARIIFAGFICVLPAFYFPLSGALLILEYLACFAFYFLLLYITRELTKFDFDVFFNILKRRA